MDRQEVQVRTGWWVAAAFGLYVAMTLAYFLWFGVALRQPLSEDASKWGTFGDYVGGLLNPLVALMALYWLTQSVRLQKEELAATRAELRDAATAQRRQVQIAARASRLSAIDTLISTSNQEAQFLSAHLWRIHEAQRIGVHCIGLHGEPLLSTQLSEEAEKTRLELDKVTFHRDGLKDLLHETYKELRELESDHDE